MHYGAEFLPSLLSSVQTAYSYIVCYKTFSLIYIHRIKLLHLLCNNIKNIHLDFINYDNPLKRRRYLHIFFAAPG